MPEYSGRLHTQRRGLNQIPRLLPTLQASLALDQAGQGDDEPLNPICNLLSEAHAFEAVTVGL